MVNTVGQMMATVVGSLINHACNAVWNVGEAESNRLGAANQTTHMAKQHPCAWVAGTAC